VSASSFREFVASISGHPCQITPNNISDLQLLCDEFAFTKLRAEIASFKSPL
jgi:hypothetical protein